MNSRPIHSDEGRISEARTGSSALLVSLLCGLVGLIYAIQHFEQAKIPLGLLAGGIVLQIVGAAMGGIPMAT